MAHATCINPQYKEHIQTLIYFKLNWIVIWLISVHALEKEVMAVPSSILHSSPIWGYSPFSFTGASGHA